MKHTEAFTLVELMVVVTIIIVLVAMLVPAVETAFDHAKRARCAANLDAIGLGAATYATANQSVLFISRGRGVQICFNPKGTKAHANRPEDALVDWPAALASVGLAGSGKERILGGKFTDNVPSPVWDCPSRGYASQWDETFTKPRQMIVSYAYYGGIETWYNADQPGGMESASPLKTTDNGRWTLASDYTVSPNRVWGIGDTDPTKDWARGSPAHRTRNKFPAGQNQVYLDGSVEWVEAERLIFIHAWNPPSWALPMYFWQQDLNGWQPSDGSYLRNDPAFSE